jgi:bidirectional [NiFe] hydrogenase diaphorase subunit
MDRSELLAAADKARHALQMPRVHCCTASGCLAGGSANVLDRLRTAAGGQVPVVGVGCLGLCGRGPLVEVNPGPGRQAVLFEHVTPESAADVVAAAGGALPDLPRCDTSQPFFSSQHKVVCAGSGKIDPERIEEYLAIGGYQALHQALTEMRPADVVQMITKSGLRGRGGAGYPTGLKWSTVARAAGTQKYVVCNGDEGDPGAFMDRSVMESDPHRVLEGMAVAAYAVGASQGYIYVRAEYPLAVSRLRKAIQQAQKLGVLGSGVFESAFDFRVDVRIGAGAFVCGEETALIASIQGQRGNPRPRPPYPAESGLWSAPTLINNVETFANVSTILVNGPEWFAGIGTEKSKGTKVFSLTGKVCNTGLIEVPMGTSLRHIVEDMGGGVSDGGTVKAVQTGGPSGGCIPAAYLDTPVDYESLVGLGSIMGSGGMIVMDQSSNMVEVARFFMEFCKDESCGKCIPCRAGTVQLLNLLTKITRKKAGKADLEQLIQLCHMVRDTSLCGLGQTAPNPVLSTLRYFRDEYESLLQANVTENGRGAIPLTLV